MKKDEAANIFGVTEKSIKHFKVQDPYNPQWELEGYINTSNTFYGSMVIIKINDYLTEQIIIGTPKQHYPFDKLGRFKFPSAKHINVYEKLDGTAVLGYGYKIKKKTYITYKTRLNPILNQSKWGNWKKMWDEMLAKYSKLSNFVEDVISQGINPSFELWGSRNPHLIQYTTPLDTSFLFGVRNEVTALSIIDPANIDFETYYIQCAHHEASINGSQDLYSWYQKLRNQQEAINKFTEDEKYIKGGEGFVWYLLDINNVMHQYKNKPASVEDIHWASTGISKNAIMTTIINCYEDEEEVTYEKVKELLTEEFDERRIDLCKDLILRVMADVMHQINFRDRVLRIYNEIGLSLKENKTETMRMMSEFFDKHEMRKVYNALRDEIEGGIK